MRGKSKVFNGNILSCMKQYSLEKHGELNNQIWRSFDGKTERKNMW